MPSCHWHLRRPRKVGISTLNATPGDVDMKRSLCICKAFTYVGSRN